MRFLYHFTNELLWLDLKFSEGIILDLIIILYLNFATLLHLEWSQKHIKISQDFSLYKQYILKQIVLKTPYNETEIRSIRLQLYSLGVYYFIL